MESFIFLPLVLEVTGSIRLLLVKLWPCSSSSAAAFLLLKPLISSSSDRRFSSSLPFSSWWSLFSCSKRPCSCAGGDTPRHRAKRGQDLWCPVYQA
ncbi:hypothetical protein NHX12_014570 [Muraenolepis orangiensis]|uniref:Uncharacterized protein n=1 Tax=Muraenolepis orangiensis TaxID=630683 RepID=A0A9Q0D8D3_9TELE|nr:hypothetical protein NHX12_014570 [Muraenolepis orangiensis]